MYRNTTPYITGKPADRPDLTGLRHASEQWQQSDNPVMRLVRQLQVTLDLETQAGIFARELARVVAFDHLKYRYTMAEQEFVYATGLGGPHRCEYSLTLEGVNYGQVLVSRRQRFADAELEAIEHMLGAAMPHFRNACRFLRVEQASLTDSLTGIPNKRALDKALARECRLNDRHGDAASVILCDLDHFKAINDSHGHVTGDHILAAVARELEYAVRSSDEVFRFGGEEFAMILPHTAAPEARQVADRVRACIAGITVQMDGGDVSLTASAGIATLLRGEPVDRWLNRADEALYKAKAGGRNQTCIAPQMSSAG